MLSHVIYIFLEFKAQYNLSVESNQNVESKRQSVETKIGKMRSPTLLKYEIIDVFCIKYTFKPKNVSF